MNWTQIIADIRARGLTLQQIADKTGMSKGAVHDLMNGRAKTVLYETGTSLVALHRKIIRRKVTVPTHSLTR